MNEFIAKLKECRTEIDNATGGMCERDDTEIIYALWRATLRLVDVLIEKEENAERKG